MSATLKSGKTPSFIPISPYRSDNWKVDQLKEELKNRSLLLSGKKEDLLRRLELNDAVRSGGVDYSSWKVPELKEEAIRRGISDAGLKADLVQRLQNSDTTGSAENDEEEEEAEEEEEEEEEETTVSLHELKEDPASPSNNKDAGSSRKALDQREEASSDFGPSSPERKTLRFDNSPPASPVRAAKTSSAPSSKANSPAASSAPSSKTSSPATSSGPKSKEIKTIEVIPMNTPVSKVAADEPSNVKMINSFTVVPRDSKKKALEALQKRHKEEAEKLTFFSAPISTIGYFVSFALEKFRNTVLYYVENFMQLIAIFAFVALVLALIYVDGIHSPFVRQAEKFVLWYGGWVVLGFASSAGIGSGLHTFLLYLGPFIAQATIKAYTCGSADISVTEDSNIFAINLVCNSAHPVEPVLYISLFQLVNIIKWESFCWGAGTAIGELPPYFLARAAASAGETAEDNEEFAELMAQERSGEKLSLAVRMKLLCFKIMKNLGFFGILLLASVPNPLFDLAGIFSGLLKLPFWEFFGATLIGKAVVKVSLQTFFMVTLFSKPSFEFLLDQVENLCNLEFVKNLAPSLNSVIVETLENSKRKYESPTGEDPIKSVFSHFFDAFFYIVLGVCLISIIQSLASVQLKSQQSRELRALEKSQKEQATAKSS